MGVGGGLAVLEFVRHSGIYFVFPDDRRGAPVVWYCRNAFILGVNQYSHPCRIASDIGQI